MKSVLPITLYRCCILIFVMLSTAIAQERSIRFYGNGYSAPGADRVKIALTESSAANVGNDFTIECWLKCVAGENSGNVSEAEHGDGWITGNIFLDRDVYGTPETGDFGLAIGGATGLPTGHRVVAFGINRLDSGITIRGNKNVADNNWHHIAVTRNAMTGEIRLFIDGLPDASGYGPSGSIQYSVGRNTAYPNSDPYIVLGAEKHDAGGAYPSFSGFMDELRISSTIRYTGSFKPSAIVFTPDSLTAALYHFNEGKGSLITDIAASAKGPSNGELYTGGSPAGPVWLSESPFRNNFSLKWQNALAKKQGQRVIINWHATSAPQSSVFEIQRSSNGNQFTTISQQNNQRECDSTCLYSYSDTHPFEGKNYYRIKNITASGEISYSPILHILFTQKIHPYKVYQSGNSLVVQNSSSIASLVIWNSQGKRLADKKNLQEGTTQVSLNNSKGFVFVHINLEDGTRFTEKIVLR